MKQISNPPSRFDPLYLEWEVEPPAARIEVYEDQTRSILARNESPDVPFRWSVNPYRGCTHACSYCYARPTHEYLGFGAGTDFDTRIAIKLRAPALLRAALAKPSWRGERIALSGDTDCYQPLEARYRLTRGCLEALRDAGNPTTIVTKSFLITRDLDILTELARDGLVTVAMSIAFADDALARQMDPGAPRPSKRFEAMRLLSDAGVPTEILIAPVIPGLNDEQIPRLLARAKECGAVGASHILLRLPGPVQDVFFERLQRELPLRVERVRTLLGEARGGNLGEGRFGHRMTGTGAYWKLIEQTFEHARRRNGLDGDWHLRHDPPPKPRPKRGQLPLFE